MADRVAGRNGDTSTEKINILLVVWADTQNRNVKDDDGYWCRD